MTKKEKYIFGAIVVALLGVFTFTDLQISTALYTKNIFGRIFEVVGEVPALFICLFGCAILFKYRSRKNLAVNILLGIAFGFLALSFAFMGGFMVSNYIAENLETSVSIILVLGIAIVMLVGSILLSNLIPKTNTRQAVTFAIIAIVYFVSLLIIFNVLKGIWGRMRMRAMTDPATQFTPWYVINNRGGFDNEFASFPSGHAANSAVIMIITLLPALFTNLKNKETLLKTISYVWIVTVAISRIVMGAHFASDVLVGATLSIVLLEVWRFIICKIRKDNLIELIKNE